MKAFNIKTNAFYELVRAGLWEQEAQLSSYGKVDYSLIMRLAEEQSVVGLLTAGLEHVVDVKVPKEDALQFVGQALQLEQRNIAMNAFIRDIVDKLRKEDIYTLLVKGQGVAQCYERPLWRAAGDVDFYLSELNYQKAKAFITPLASYVESEDKRRLHFGMTIDPWIVELHGTLHSDISFRMNTVLDDVHHDVFYNGNIRSWNNNGVTVFLPDANNDVIIIFSHFINHFYGEGIGLRQICDWCRLLWKYKDEIDISLLEKRLKRMRLMNEWKAFGAFAVEFLGMPLEAMPYYESSNKIRRKAKKISELIIETGSFGVNKDNSYRGNNQKWRKNVITLTRRFGEFRRIASIFPINAPLFFVNYVFNRLKAMTL